MYSWYRWQKASWKESYLVGSHRGKLLSATYWWIFQKGCFKIPSGVEGNQCNFYINKKGTQDKKKKKYLLTQSQKKGRYMRSQDNDRERIEKEKWVEIFFQWAKMANGLPGQSSSGLESQLCHLLVDDLGQVR